MHPCKTELFCQATKVAAPEFDKLAFLEEVNFEEVIVWYRLLASVPKPTRVEGWKGAFLSKEAFRYILEVFFHKSCRSPKQ